MLISLRKMEAQGGVRVRSFRDAPSGVLLFRDADYELCDALRPGGAGDLAGVRAENADVVMSALLAVSAAEGYEMVYCHLRADSYPRSYEVIEGLWGAFNRQQAYDERGPLFDYFFSIAFSSDVK